MASRSISRPLMPDFNSWISDLDLSSPSILEQKVDEICSGIEDRLNPKNEIEYIKVMQSHLLLEVWSQIRIFKSEQYQNKNFIRSARVKLNRHTASISIRSSKTHIQIPPSSYLLLLWQNTNNQKPISKQIDDESKANHSTSTSYTTEFPPHALVQVATPKMTANKSFTTWEIPLSLNDKSYELIKENHSKYGKTRNLNVVPIKNLIYLQRDYDAVKSVDRMPLSLYIMRKEHLNQGTNGNESLLHLIQNHDLVETYFSQILNKSQYLALRESLTKPLTLIHGPPGTGKTKFALLPILKCVHLALQCEFDALNRKNIDRIKGRNVLKQIDRVWRVGRIGVFAGSNQAIDEIVLTMLGNTDIAIARMGNTYNMDATVAKHKEINFNHRIDYYLAFKWDKQTKREVYNWRQKCNQRVNAIQAELEQIEKDLSQVIAKKGSQLSVDDKVWQSVKTLFIKSRPLRLELQCLNKVEEIRYPNQAQRKLLHILMNQCEVLFSTANYLGRCMNETILRFDFGIFDECCQMRETETLIALQHCLRAVLIGDPKQLQAMITYHGKYRNVLLNSLFSRIAKYIEPIMLTEQYRMNKEISLFPSQQFYDGKLLNAKGERIKSFHQDKSGVFKPYLFFDVCGVEEKKGHSLVNVAEIECIQTLIHNFTKNEAYLQEIDSIGIITPYLAHKDAIDLALADTKRDLLQQHRINIECVTVDEFQGAERDIILFSCVRSNNTNNIGFLNDVARLNVAITRAKYALWIIGNADCLKSSDATWNALVQDACKRNLLIDKYFCEC